MPELPEVETTRRGIAPHVEGENISQVVVRQPQLRWQIPADLNKTLTGLKIDQVERRAKYLLLRTGPGTLIIHLGMSGSLRVMKTAEPAGRHDHVDICFSSGTRLRYCDPRRFGAILWQPGDKPCQHKLLRTLGPEPLEPGFDGDHLFQASRGRSQAVKTFIMDNHVVVGVGNIYANESLFLAGIRPDRAAGRISRARYQKLAEVIKQVLTRAIACGGTTLKDFVGGDGKPGYFRIELSTYGRAGQPCSSCGRELKETKLGQRTTVFCPHCQT